MLRRCPHAACKRESQCGCSASSDARCLRDCVCRCEGEGEGEGESEGGGEGRGESGGEGEREREHMRVLSFERRPLSSRLHVKV